MSTDELAELGDIRARCSARLDALVTQLSLDSLTGVDELCAVLTSRRGRPLLAEAVPLPRTIAGVWVANARADYIFYAQDAPRPHQEHIILHEVAHLLCEHAPGPAKAELLQALLFPHLDRAIVQTALGRGRYDTREEREAELLATLIEHRWLCHSRWRGEVGPSDPDKADEERDTAERLDALAQHLRAHVSCEP